MDSPRKAIPRAFRIASSRHPVFDGGGAQRYGARWNSPGLRAVYAAETYAGALLEVLVHARTGHVPRDLVWIEIGMPATIATAALEKDEVPGWNSPDYGACRKAGDAWLRAKSTAILLVPSVATGGVERNVIINPDHDDARGLSVSEPRPVAWDKRLWPSRGRR